MDRRLGRRLVALAAAYAVALNTLLPALAVILSPVASDALDPAVICSGVGAASAPDSGAPEKPRPHCPGGGVCAMPGCAAAGLLAAGPVVAVATWWRAAPVGLRRDGRQTQTFRLGGHNLARGPPIG